MVSDLFPRNCFNLTRIKRGNTCLDFLAPGLVYVCVSLGFDTFEKSAGDLSSFRVGKSKRVFK